MTSSIRRLFVIAAFTVASAAPAAAQDTMSAAYQYFNFSAGGLGNHMPLGVAVDYARQVGGPWRLVASFDWSQDTEDYPFQFEPFLPTVDVHATLTMTTYAGGVRWTGAGGDAGFFQLLGGLTRTRGAQEQNGEDAGSDAVSDFMLQPGAGIAFPLGGRWSAIGQFDYRAIFSDGGSQNGLRLAGGVRVKLTE